MLNTDLMIKNIKADRMGAVSSQVDVVRDLIYKPEYSNNSWFAFGRFETGGHTISYLFHLMVMQVPVIGQRCQSVVTVFDETTGEYYAKDYLYPKSQTHLDATSFCVKVPNGSMSGDWDRMAITITEGDFQLDVEAAAIHYPVMSGGTSVFEILGMLIRQYSVPYMKTSGTLSWKGKSYDLTGKGYTWFDRQWQRLEEMKSPKWSWMAIYLDNGDVISAFDGESRGRQTGLLSALKADGSQINSCGIPSFRSGEREHWYSESSGQKYPVRWTLSLPPLDAELEVVPIKKEQEIVSVMKQLSKYEGVCTVKGTYMGQPAAGHALVELIGRWPK